MTRAKTKVIPICARCLSDKDMVVTLKNGEQLPSYAIDMATGKLYCHPCNNARKAE